MILSASDIYALLIRDPILGALATVRIIDQRPPLEAGNGVYIYIKKYPAVEEFEVTWNIWIVDYDEDPLDVVIGQIRRLLPRFTILENGAIIKAATTELKTHKTVVKPSPAKPELEIPTIQDLDSRFEDLRQSIEDRMLLVGPGRPGRDGKNGKDGRDGRDGLDGQDLKATETELGDLKNVFVDDAKRGQFLMFDGADWISRSVPQILNASGGGGGAGGGIEEAPQDGNFYVRRNGAWVNLIDAISAISNIDAGNFTLGTADAISAINNIDAGNFTLGTADATQSSEPNGGNFSL